MTNAESYEKGKAFFETFTRFLKKDASFLEMKTVWVQILSPLPKKEVSWEIVRNIANCLINQLVSLSPEAYLEMAHMSCFAGVERLWTSDGTGKFLDANWDNQGWMEFREEQVLELFWCSSTSGNSLQAQKTSPGKWTIQYRPSEKNPLYRGAYFEMYDRPEDVENIERPVQKEATIPAPPLTEEERAEIDRMLEDPLNRF
jgi:hypothetical protein